MNTIKKNTAKKNKALSAFGDWLKEKRIAKEMTQDQARKLAKPEISLNTWSALERGEAKPREDTLRRAARAVEADQDEVQRVVTLAWAGNAGGAHVLSGRSAPKTASTLAEEAEQAQKAKDYGRAEVLLRQAIAAEPTRETYYRELMLMLHQQGKSQDAEQVYYDLLNVVTMPTLETRQRFRRIQFEEQDAPGTLVGRGTNRGLIAEKFAVTRLVTLTGEEGVGKTALAQAVADDLKGEFRDGVCFVSLGTFVKTRYDLMDWKGQERVAQAVLFALKSSSPVGPMSSSTYYSDTLIGALETSARLIVLDGCTELRGGCADLVRRLLRRCEYVYILATCRNEEGEEGLGLQDIEEKLFPVLPLVCPTGEKSAAEMRDSTAALLFELRAAQVQEDFNIEDDTESVSAICERTQGFTTYIGWAASLLKSKTLQKIADIPQPKPKPDPKAWREWLLTTSLSETEQSLTLSLGSAERSLLKRLTIFPNGWTRDAAQEVCSDENIPRWLIPTLLEMLDAQGLIHREGRRDSDRGWVWEPLYESTRREISGADRDQLMEKLLDWCIEVAEKGDLYQRVERVEQRYDQIEGEIDNIRAALAWALADPPRQPAKGLYLADLIWGGWNVRGYWTEGRYWLKRALEVFPGDNDADKRAGALNGAAILAVRQRDYQDADDKLKQALVCASQDRQEEAEKELKQPWKKSDNPMADKARRTPIFESLNLKASILNSLGFLYRTWGENMNDQDKLDQARGYYEQARERYPQRERDGFWTREAKWPQNGLGELEMAAYKQAKSAKKDHEATDHLTKAEKYNQTSLEIAEEFKDKDGVAQARRHLAEISQAIGILDKAEQYFMQSLAALNELGNKADTISLVENLAEIATHKGTAKALEKAVRLYAGAENLRRIYGVFNESEKDYRQQMDTMRRTLGSRLGETEYAKQWREGLQKSPNEVIYLALSEAP
jgi:transcriptional regulator with XRE-family HTH domain